MLLLFDRPNAEQISRCVRIR